jgi:hypothetical protein
MTRVIVVAALGVALVGSLALAQDSVRAKQTRALLKKTTLDPEWKEEMTRVILAELKSETNDKVTFIVDTVSGMSMNSRMTYKAKKVSIEKILNELADKNDFGWFVFSNPKDPNDQKNGKVILRKGAKGKERGYEFGTEPKEDKKEKESSSLEPGRLPIPPGMSHIIGINSRGGNRWNFQPIPGR